MPLIILNNQNKEEEEVKKVETVEVKVQPTISPNKSPILRMHNDDIKEDEHHHILIINGKKKPIKKHSVYLLDMLTLEE